MDLRIYDGKNIMVTDLDGQTFVGFADYHDAEDNASGVSSLTVILDGSLDIAHDFEEHEITNIKILNVDASALAAAV